jgi:hypothetical protein
MLQKLSILLLLIVLFSCNTPSASRPKEKGKTDTILAYVNLPRNSPGTDSVLLITKMNRKFDNDSSLTAHWSMDTTYVLGHLVKDTTKPTLPLHFEYVLRLPDTLTTYIHPIFIK